MTNAEKIPKKYKNEKNRDFNIEFSLLQFGP